MIFNNNGYNSTNNALILPLISHPLAAFISRIFLFFFSFIPPSKVIFHVRNFSTVGRANILIVS